ncbi:MAG: HDIG domain-containing protein [Candidatus Omnitrophica bacterium]|nr:HDIG domain-containing protein [Candidatus Omnitrophota bacterium]
MNEKIPLPITDLQKRNFLGWAGIAALFGGSCLLAAALICFEPEDRVVGNEFMIGDPSPRTVFSSLEFTYENNKATERFREQAEKSSEPIYRIHADLQASTLKSLDGFFEAVNSFEKAKAVNPVLKPAFPKFTFELSKTLSHVVFEEGLAKSLHEQVSSLVRIGFAKGLFDPEEQKKLISSGVVQITVVREGVPDFSLLVSGMNTTADLRHFAESFLSSDAAKNKTLKNAAADLFSIFAKPNTARDDKETLDRQKKAVEAVAPVMNKIKKNELVAQRGMLITSEDKERLDYLEKELKKHKILNQFFSIAGFSALIYLLAFLGLYFFAFKTFLSFRQVLLLHTSLILTLFISKIVAIWPGSSLYFMPTALAPLLLVLLAGPFPALVGALVMTALTALLVKFNMEVVFATLISGCAAILAGQKIRRRIQLVKVGAAVGISYFSVLFLLRIFFETPIVEAFQVSTQGLINGILTILMGYLLASLFEVVFNLTTDIYLLEMSDLNHPLLKRMIVEAPGTYHHSLVVSTLAEAACEAIQANALLARVGCYFHDIGKIAQAEYFTENSQNTAKLKHEALTSWESSLKIMEHVKGGIALGMKYKLKKPILDFIPEHQGTGVVYYFYRRAADEAKPGQRIDMNEYRYPGPKPQSRETAVALLSDSTEAASRSLKEPTPENIRRLVRKIINDKFIDGQLDECNLTLKDLYKIQESFVQNLMAIFHTRVAYPEKPQHPDQVDIFCDHHEDRP